MLFQIDLTDTRPDGVFDEFWASRETDENTRLFAEQLVWGVFDQRRELDRLIAGSAEHWRIERMAVVDRNVLRMALHEMLAPGGAPPAVIIDEAIEVAKKFGSADSGSFINGVLDAIRLRVERGEVARGNSRPGDGP
jgi:N utilization substance protein B